MGAHIYIEEEEEGTAASVYSIGRFVMEDEWEGRVYMSIPKSMFTRENK